MNSAKKEWQAHDLKVDAERERIDSLWQAVNEEWLVKLRESAERLDSMSRYCRAMEKRITILEGLMLNINAFDEILSRLPDTRRRLEKQENGSYSPPINKEYHNDGQI